MTSDEADGDAEPSPAEYLHNKQLKKWSKRRQLSRSWSVVIVRQAVTPCRTKPNATQVISHAKKRLN